MFLHPVVAGLFTVLLLCLCTQGLIALRDLSGVTRPYTILYLIPVAVGAALLGMRGGLAAALGAIILARISLFNDNKHGLALFSFPELSEAIEFAALAAGTLTIAAVTGRLRTTLGQLRATNHRLRESNTRLADANAQIIQSEQLRQAFNRDVLLAVTGGKLRLVEPQEMPPPDLVSGSVVLTLPLCKPADAGALRQELRGIGQSLEMTPERLDDLCTSTTEAATNAIKHAHGGQVRVWKSEDAVAVQVSDKGGGIAPTHLARATLEQGYSTRVSLGMGFYLMLQMADALALSTGPEGTSVLLHVTARSRPTEIDSLLARYAAL